MPERRRRRLVQQQAMNSFAATKVSDFREDARNENGVDELS